MKLFCKLAIPNKLRTVIIHEAKKEIKYLEQRLLTTHRKNVKGIEKRIYFLKHYIIKYRKIN